MSKLSTARRALANTAVASTICLIGLSLPGQASADNALHFGIVPQQSATQLARAWIPFMRELSRRVGSEITFATTKDIPTFEKCLATGAYELAYMNPYHYTVFHETSGYRAFAQQAGKRLQGVIVVRAESALKSLDDLAGAKLAVPSPAAFGASVLPRAELRGRGIPFEPNYVKSHDSVYSAVAVSLFPAGGGVKRTFASIDGKLRSQLRVIYDTKAYTAHTFAAAPKVGAELAARIGAAMAEIVKEQPALTKPIGIAAFEAAADADWNDVRALGLTAAETRLAATGDVKCHSD
jgi:phosphonate transport system substrate-binding protein